MAKVSFKRRLTNEEVDDIPVEDGNLIATKEGKLFIDYEEERKEIGGVPSGGTTGQVLVKKSDDDNDTEWVDQTGGPGGGGDSIPVGTIVEYSGNELPSGYLLCDGQEVSRTEYSSLFEVIGTTYGEGNGATTFNLPNLKGKVAVGIDEDDEDFNILAKSGGEKSHKLAVNEIPDHTHWANDVLVIGKSEVSGLAPGSAWSDTGGIGRGTNTSSSGSNQSHNNLQPYIVLNYIIKAKKTVTLESGKVVDSVEGNSVEDAPSVRAVNDAFDKHGEAVQLITFDNTNFTTKTVEDLNNFKLLIWQCCYKNQPQRVLGSVVGTVLQMKQCNTPDLTWQTTFPGNATEFMCELYYKNDTELISRITGKYAMGVLYGVRK